MATVYLTTPIYYVNDVPHLGTAYTTVICDALRRFHALAGDDVRMLTGTDEHGLKLERTAKDQGMTPQAFVDQTSAPFRAAWPKLGVETDDFIRTTESRHTRFVQELWRTIERKGDLYEGEYEDWYCVGCETFKTEKELAPGNICPIHQRPAERLKERTFFFRLSKYTDSLLRLYDRHLVRDARDHGIRPFVEPGSRLNEVRSFVAAGLKDLSVSRTTFDWGIPVPEHPEHVMYVWFDALTNYLSALGPEGGELRRYWPKRGQTPQQRPEVLHLVGKDILRFHAVYWPAFLLSAGFTEDELPTQIFAHGFLTIDGQKMSKSLRNSVDPLRLAEEFGADALRYQLLRAISFGQDGDFDHAAFIERINADLGKNLGNLLNRTLGLCAKLTDCKVPTRGQRTDLETDLEREVTHKLHLVRHAWQGSHDARAPHRALEETMAIASLANQYIDRAAPWAEAKKGDTPRVGRVLGTLLDVLGVLSTLISPAMPVKSAEMRRQLGLAPLCPKAGSMLWPAGVLERPAGEALTAGAPLFPVIDKDREKELLEKLMPAKEVSAVTTKDETKGPEEGANVAKVSAPTAPGEPPPTVSYDDFAKVDLRVGVVREAERIPKKDKLLRLTVDLGEATARTIIAGIALSFSPEALIGRRVVVVANLAPRDFGKGLISHGMLLASGPSDALHLGTIDEGALPGAKLK